MLDGDTLVVTDTLDVPLDDTVTLGELDDVGDTLLVGLDDVDPDELGVDDVLAVALALLDEEPLAVRDTLGVPLVDPDWLVDGDDDGDSDGDALLDADGDDVDDALLLWLDDDDPDALRVGDELAVALLLLDEEPLAVRDTLGVPVGDPDWLVDGDGDDDSNGDALLDADDDGVDDALLL